MNNNYEIFDAKVEKFLRNQMTEEEEKKFKAELSSSKELMSRARTIALAVREMRVVAEEKDTRIIKAISRLDEKQFRKVAGIRSKVVRLMPRIISIAVAACVIGIIINVGNRMHIQGQYSSLGNETNYYAYNMELPDDYRHMRGGSDNEMLHVLNLFEKVEKGEDLKNVIPELEFLCEEFFKDESDMNYYWNDVSWNLAIAYLKNGDGKKAIKILEQMKTTNADNQEVLKAVEDLLEKARAI